MLATFFLPWLDSYSIFFTSTRASLQITLGICSTMWSAVTIPTCKEGTGSRESDLFLKICNYYAAAPANEIASQLGNLTEGMIRKTASSSLKLRAKAAEARSLVNFAVQLCYEAFPPEAATGQEAGMKQAVLRLQRCYACLHDDRYDQNRLLAACSQLCSLVRFCKTRRPICSTSSLNIMVQRRFASKRASPASPGLTGMKTWMATWQV